MGAGAALGACEGFRYSRKDYLPYNFLFTVLGMGWGTMGGLFAGLLWPVTGPFLLARAYYPADDSKKQ